MKIWRPRAASGSADILLRFNPNEIGGGDYAVLDRVRGRPAASEWKPHRAEIGLGKPKHFVNLGGDLTCNREAWEIIGHHVRDDAEGLPIQADGQTFYIVNVTRVVD